MGWGSIKGQMGLGVKRANGRGGGGPGLWGEGGGVWLLCKHASSS